MRQKLQALQLPSNEVAANLLELAFSSNMAKTFLNTVSKMLDALQDGYLPHTKVLI